MLPHHLFFPWIFHTPLWTVSNSSFCVICFMEKSVLTQTLILKNKELLFRNQSRVCLLKLKSVVIISQGCPQQWSTSWFISQIQTFYHIKLFFWLYLNLAYICWMNHSPKYCGCWSRIPSCPPRKHWERQICICSCNTKAPIKSSICWDSSFSQEKKNIFCLHPISQKC